MHSQILRWLQERQLYYPELIAAAIILAFAFICLILIHFILQHVVLKKLIQKRTSLKNQTDFNWREIFINSSLFNRLLFIVEGFIFHLIIVALMQQENTIQYISLLIDHVWILVFSLLAIFSLLDIILAILNKSPTAANLPLRGVAQGIKLIVFLVFSILIISVLINKSPLFLLSGLGAMSAITMLIFKDPILGFAAGFQLSANNLLIVGDWLEMPNFGADGEVLDIGLTTVKVRNWDKTITTIPTYSLITNSFRNWRGMQESGGRRIKRSVIIDTTSIHFLNDEEKQHLSNSELLAPYFSEKKQQIEQYNTEKQANLKSPLNGRRLTNIGTFRAYLVTYLKNHPNINQNMTLMVRQLAHSGDGLPIEIYAFTNTTAWIDYEDIQGDIFDHILAVAHEFSLHVFQKEGINEIQQIELVSKAKHLIN